MQQEAYYQSKFRNTMHALALFAAMIGVLALVGLFIFGTTGLLVMAVSGALALFFAPRVSPRLTLKLYNARPLSPGEAPGLYQIVSELARRAGLERTPEIFYIRSAGLNAFSLGSRKDAGIALTDGILRAMNMRELTGILAHELSHVRGNDMWVMGLADIISRMTSFLSLAGQILLLINLPLLLTGQLTISWWLILLLIFSPNAVALLQLGLSRSREFNADMDAARLTGDPRGLASALSKLERAEQSILARLIMPGRKVPVPSVLRTHPDTAERVKRLLELEGRDQAHPFGDDRPSLPGDLNRPPLRAPRRRWNGLWY